METLGVIATFGSHEAFAANVTGSQQPDSRQGNSRLLGQTLNDAFENILHNALAGNGSGGRK
jgi:hypothetical protein